MKILTISICLFLNTQLGSQSYYIDTNNRWIPNMNLMSVKQIKENKQKFLIL